MKKMIKSVLVMLLGLLMSVNVMADVQQEKQNPDYTTDYYMIVESKAGGIDIYSLPDLNSAKLNDEQIPNGTALHIEGETEDQADGRTWGYTEYHGMYGYVPLDDCKPAQSRKEAIDSELYIAGRDNVDYNADYNVRAYSEDGTQKLYQGPGTKYGEVPGVHDIQNGETLHITEDAELVDGSHWGVTTIDDKEGWVDLEKTEEWAKEHGTYENTATADSLEMTPLPDNASSEKNSVTAAPAVSETPTPVPTETAKEVSTAPTVTGSAKQTPTVTETADISVTPTETPEAAEKLTPAESKEATETPVPTETDSKDKDNVQTSGQTVQEQKSSWSSSPLIWIAVLAVLAAAGVVIYHYKKR